MKVWAVIGIYNVVGEGRQAGQAAVAVPAGVCGGRPACHAPDSYDAIMKLKELSIEHKL